MSQDNDNQNDVYVLPMWGEATITQVLCPSLPSERERGEILGRIRDARLAEVEQLELIMQDKQLLDIRTSEIRRIYKIMKIKLRKYEEKEQNNESKT